MFARMLRFNGPKATKGLAFFRRYNSGTGSKHAKSSFAKIIYPVSIFTGGALTSLIYYKSTTSTPTSPKDSNSSTTKLSDLGPIEYGSDEDFKQAIKEITAILGDKYVSFDEPTLDSHNDTFFQTHHPLPGQKPRAVLYPGSTKEVSKILKVLHKYKIPVVPYAGGTSIEGQFIASRCGVSVDVTRMDQIVEFNPKDLDITVQASVGWQDLAEFLTPHGLMFGPDPGPGAHIAGMCSTNCSGTNAARYGTMRDNVLSLTVVLPDGTIVKTKKRPRKSSAGYNLTGLFIGSEGTLGVITEITLKLHVKPEEETIAVVNFNSIGDATDAVSAIFAKGIQLNAMELLDTNLMKCINVSGSTSKAWTEKPTLFLKIGGSPVIVKELVKSVKQIAKDSGSLDFQFAQSEQEKEELWSARRMALWSTIDWGKRSVSEDSKVYITDVAVPLSRLSKVITETQEDLEAHDFKATILGHVGDGNFHALVIYQPSQDAEIKALISRMVDRALENEGTCTGEHGVGVGKRGFLVKEVGEDAIGLMRKVKLAIDPLRLFNADKVFKIDPTEEFDH